tara:strand:- start:1252 stop:2004 length:753 start_codon:yes stop_codon:yes gene_type:complete
MSEATRTGKLIVAAKTSAITSAAAYRTYIPKLTLHARNMYIAMSEIPMDRTVVNVTYGRLEFYKQNFEVAGGEEMQRITVMMQELAQNNCPHEVKEAKCLGEYKNGRPRYVTVMGQPAIEADIFVGGYKDGPHGPEFHIRYTQTFRVVQEKANIWMTIEKHLSEHKGSPVKLVRPNAKALVRRGLNTAKRGVRKNLAPTLARHATNMVRQAVGPACLTRQDAIRPPPRLRRHERSPNDVRQLNKSLTNGL